MEKLLKFLILNITGDKSIKITSQEDDGGVVNLNVTAPQDKIGMIIGKKGKTIKTIRNLIKIKATLDKKRVNLSVNEE